MARDQHAPGIDHRQRLPGGAPALVGPGRRVGRLRHHRPARARLPDRKRGSRQHPPHGDTVGGRDGGTARGVDRAALPPRFDLRVFRLGRLLPRSLRQLPAEVLRVHRCRPRQGDRHGAAGDHRRGGFLARLSRGREHGGVRRFHKAGGHRRARRIGGGVWDREAALPDRSLRFRPRPLRGRQPARAPRAVDRRAGLRDLPIPGRELPGRAARADHEACATVVGGDLYRVSSC